MIIFFICFSFCTNFITIFSEGANGDGMAIVSSLRSFDREQQKEYLIPIVIKDHGTPAMTGTSTLTVSIFFNFIVFLSVFFSSYFS